MESKIVPLASESIQWHQWGNYHRQMFGWKQDSDVEMIALWIGTFRRWLFTPSEMYAATESILKRSAPAFKREDHINYLYSAVNDKRMKLRNVIPSDEYTRGQCSLCFNSGLVTVPWLRDIDMGEWISKKTCGVWCTCYDGNKYSAVRTEDGRKLMGLPEYNSKNPIWQIQMGERRARDVELDYLSSEARESSGGEDKSHFEIIRDRMAVRFGLLPGD